MNVCQRLADELSRDLMAIHNDEVFRSPVVCDVLGYALYDKGQVFPPLSSSVQERGTILAEALWSLEIAHTTFVIIIKTHLLGDSKCCCFE